MNILNFFRRNRWNIPNNILSEYNKLRGKDKIRLCYAPYQSLTFKPDGCVYACFDNIRKKLGEYPQNSIAEIWNGEKIKKLRERIAKHCLDYGCEECFNQLLLKNFYSVTAWHYDYIRPINKKTVQPTAFDFQLSNICNYECIMCSGELSTSIRNNREHSPLYGCPYDDKFIEQLRPYIPNLQNASFTGGETFLNPLYYKIWDIIAEENPNCIISVSTNGSILDERIKSYMERLKFNVTISINAVDEDIYKSIHVGGNMETVLNNYKYFKEYCKQAGTQLMIKICPLRQNIYHIPTLMQYFNQNDTCLSFNKVMYPPHCSLWNLPPNELCKIIDFLKQNIKDAATKTERLNNSRYDTLINQLSRWLEDGKKREELNINGQSANDLLIMFRKKIIDYYSILNMAHSESKTEIKSIFGKIEEIEKSFDNNIFKEFMAYITALPPSFVIPHLKQKSVDILRYRIQYSFITIKNKNGNDKG